MKDAKFFAQVLGLVEPWDVKTIDLNMEDEKVVVVLEAKVPRGGWLDSAGNPAQVHGYETRKWKHMDTMQLETILEAKVPRLLRTDGGTEMVVVPWAEAGSRFTLMFEGWCIKMLLASSNIERARQLLKLEWSSVQKIMARAVERGLQRRDDDPLKRVGIDEKSFLRGQSFVSVLSDLDGGRILEVGLGRDSQATSDLWKKLPEEVRTQIEVVAMDMSKVYQTVTQQEVPQADVAHDKFHVSQHLHDAVDQVRRAEAKKLDEQGDDTLKNSRYYWLYNPKNLKPWRLERFEKLVESELLTAKAWMIKNLWAKFWDEPDVNAAELYFTEWKKEALKTELKPVEKVVGMIERHFKGILAAFKHRVTNAVTEGLNSKIQSLKSAARGFRNFENYRVRILFFCGKLDLMPSL